MVTSVTGFFVEVLLQDMPINPSIFRILRVARLTRVLRSIRLIQRVKGDQRFKFIKLIILSNFISILSAIRWHAR